MNLAETYNPHVDCPRIWTRRPRILEARDPIVFRTAVEGRFTLRPWAPGRITDPRRVATIRNLITTQGLNQIGNIASYLNRCAVGAGTDAPDEADTGLKAQIAATTSVVSSTDGSGGSSPDLYGYRTKVFRFSAGQAAGNLAEVGIGPGTAGSLSVFSRARILDAEGNPTTLTVLSDEFLDVTYDFRCYVSEVDDVPGEISISSLPYATVTRPSIVGERTWRVAANGNRGGINTAGLNAYATQTLGPMSGGPSGLPFAGTVEMAAYANGDFFRDAVGFWGISAGNTGSGIGSVRFMLADGASILEGMGAVQVSFNPVIPKEPGLALALPLRHEWARRPA